MNICVPERQQEFVEPHIEPNRFVFVPLGGVGEIGVNVYLYHYAGKWLMVDLGIGFADEDFPGIDVTVADIEFIAKRKKDLVGIVITHAHEDHLGAVQYLWENLKCPVYTHRFTAEFLRSKLIDCELHNTVPINEIVENKDVDIGPFKIKLIPFAHSIPAMQAVLIKAGDIKLLHTGDWRLDREQAALLGDGMDIDEIIKIGNEGLTAAVCDSTCVFVQSPNPSETSLLDSFISLFENVDGAIIVTMFASNVYRLVTLCRVAERLGRTMILSGRSVWRMSNVATSTGYLPTHYVFVDENKCKQIPRHKWLVVCTGCQGEPRAAITKFTNPGLAGEIKVMAGDLVVFSSKAIPGNEKKIQKLYNKIIRAGAKLLTESSGFVHVSGHPSAPEMRELYSWLKPKLVIPVHGEDTHIFAHVKLALECGAKQSVQTNNGDVIAINEDGSYDFLGKIQTGVFGVDGNFLQPVDGKVMSDRRRMQNSGAIFIVINSNRDGGFAKAPIVQVCGVFDVGEEKELFNSLVEEVKRAAGSYRGRCHSNFNRVVQAAVSEFCETELKKSPLIKVVINETGSSASFRSGNSGGHHHSRIGGGRSNLDRRDDEKRFGNIKQV